MAASSRAASGSLNLAQYIVLPSQLLKLRIVTHLDSFVANCVLVYVHISIAIAVNC